MTCLRCQHQICKKFGYFGKRRIQRWRCNSCKATFAEPQPQSPLGTMRTSTEAAESALHCLLEGCSIRSTERLTGLNRNTIMRLLLVAGEHSSRLMDTRMRGLSARYLQVDEIWTYVGKKRRNVRSGDSPELGDQWIYVAIDAETKLIPSFRIGKRVRPDTWAFLWDLNKRIANRVQLTTDGLNHYTVTVPECFGTDVDFAQLTKMFGDYGQFDTPDARYSPPRISGVISKVRQGNPDPDHISTSFVERQNLTMRMAMRRFTRLTNTFSKKLSHLKAAVALHFAYYNFCRVHSSLRVTPAMEAGLADHVWSIAELLGAA
jgi:transposase-like protein/IS1 family transposase